MSNVEVVLVDQNDFTLGSMEKFRAHQEGVLHRAISVFLFDTQGRLLLQKRSAKKYHSGGLWSNTCCSHPKPGQTLEQSVNETLMRELNITCNTHKVGSFIYKKKLNNNLIEHEYDHIFVGEYSAVVSPNPEEVEEWKYVPIEEVFSDIKNNPTLFTPWFLEALQIALRKF